VLYPEQTEQDSEAAGLSVVGCKTLLMSLVQLVRPQRIIHTSKACGFRASLSKEVASKIGQ